MTGALISLLAFIVAISVLVAVHEFGHFLVGRLCGMKVLRFSIGFGKPIRMRVAGQDRTEYCISAIPLGGYVNFLDSGKGRSTRPIRAGPSITGRYPLASQCCWPGRSSTSCSQSLPTGCCSFTACRPCYRRSDMCSPAPTRKRPGWSTATASSTWATTRRRLGKRPGCNAGCNGQHRRVPLDSNRRRIRRRT